MNNVSLLPLWKQAVANFMDLDPKPGTVIRHDWLMEQFGIRKPLTAEDQTKASLQFLQEFTEFRDELLENYCIDLKSVQGVGHEVVHPREQTKLALKKRSQNIARELRKMARSIAYVDVSALNETERKEHSDGLAKAAALRGMFNRRQILGRD